jgi:hypothetical protein
VIIPSCLFYTLVVVLLIAPPARRKTHPRTPRGLPSVAAAPLCLDLRSREGGRLGVGWAAGGPQGGLLRVEQKV